MTAPADLLAHPRLATLGAAAARPTTTLDRVPASAGATGDSCLR
jgi:hypothetical protein